MARGQPPRVVGEQYESITEKYGLEWLNVKKKKEKNRILNSALGWAMAKYGLLNPWRTLVEDRPEPEPGVKCADDTSALSEAEIKRRQNKMRLDINRTLRRYAAALGAPQDDDTDDEDDEATTNEVKNTFAQMMEGIKSERSKVFPHWVLNDYFWQPEWSGELEAVWKLERERPRKPEDKPGLYMNTKRLFLLDKLETIDRELRMKVDEKVAELQKRAQGAQDQTLNINTTTPEECAKFAADMDPFASRFVDIMAEGTKGVVLLLVASPTVESGSPEVAVNKWEWSNIPAEIGRAGLGYSKVDVDFFARMVERFRAYGKKVFDANFTKAEIEREEAFDDLVQWQAGVSAAKGHGLMGSQFNQEGRPHERQAGELNPRLEHFLPTSEDSAMEDLIIAPRWTAKAKTKAAAEKHKRGHNGAADVDDGSELESDLAAGKKAGVDKRVKAQATAKRHEDGLGDESSDTKRTRKAKRKAKGKAKAKGSDESSDESSDVDSEGHWRPLRKKAKAAGVDWSSDDDVLERVRPAHQGRTKKRIVTSSESESPSETPKIVGTGESAQKKAAPGQAAMGTEVAVLGQGHEGGEGAVEETGDGRKSKGANPSATSQGAAPPRGRPRPQPKQPNGLLVPRGSPGGTMEGPFTQAPTHTPVFGPIFAGWNPLARVSKDQSADGVNAMVREEIKALTYVQQAQNMFGTRGHVSNAGKFLQEVGTRCVGWTVSTSVVHALMKAYLRFEQSCPPVADAPCDGWAAFDLDGEESAVRPIYLSEWATSVQKLVWASAATRGSPRSAGCLDWNFASALMRQWVALQPAERCENDQIVCAPAAEMDWGNALRGGKLGARVIVIGLLLWANVEASIEDGTSSEDWNAVAADVAQVLNTRVEQIGVEAVAASGEKQAESGEGGGQADRPAAAGRERKQSSALAYMQANGKVDLPSALKKTMGWKATQETETQGRGEVVDPTMKRKRDSKQSENGKSEKVNAKASAGAGSKRVKRD